MMNSLSTVTQHMWCYQLMAWIFLSNFAAFSLLDNGLPSGLSSCSANVFLDIKFIKHTNYDSNNVLR